MDHEREYEVYKAVNSKIRSKSYPIFVKAVVKNRVANPIMGEMAATRQSGLTGMSEVALEEVSEACVTRVAHNPAPYLLEVASNIGPRLASRFPSK